MERLIELMTARINLFLMMTFLFFLSCQKYQPDFCDRNFNRNEPLQVNRIAFGSCSSENKDQPILNQILNFSPELFIYLGDNVYCDTDDENEFRDTYRRLSCKNEFQNLIQNTYTLATWDDHDYGRNNSGLEFSFKEKAKEIFLEFWKEPLQSERYLHKGIYHAKVFGPEGRKVQIILLDCRTFRSPQIEVDGNYIQNYNSLATMLGSEQWFWLEQQMLVPADLRIICSSTQFGVEHNGWESWSNYPNEIEKMFQLLRNTRAEHVIFLSGDVHYAELSKREPSYLYPIYDFTSSGLTNIDDYLAQNKYRVGNGVREINAGLVDIDWNNKIINFNVIDINGVFKFTHQITFQELKF